MPCDQVMANDGRGMRMLARALKIGRNRGESQRCDM